MSTPIQFKAGQVQTFIATRSFSLGQTGVVVPEGSEVQYDGTSVSYAGLAPVVMPQLRGAIRAGWVVPQTSYDPSAPAQRPQSAGIQMRSADGGNPMDPNPRRVVGATTEAEEREVGNVSEHAAATRDVNRENYRRQRTPRSESTAGQRNSSGSVEPQEGVPVQGIRLQTPAGERAKRSTVDVTRAGEAISRAEKVKIKPGRGRTREELIRDAIERENLTPEELADYQEELAATRSVHGVDVGQQVVGRVAAPGSKQTEGFDVTGSVGGGVAIADLGGTGGTTKTQVHEEEGIKFTTTGGPKKGVRLVDKTPAPAIKTTEDIRRKIAKSMCPDFPDLYNFDDPERKKIARIQADFEDQPDVIRAIFAAESDAMKARLVDEFPDAFGGP